MIFFWRKLGDGVIIGEDVHVSVVQIRGGRTRLGIEAPYEVPVHRQEVYEGVAETYETDSGRCVRLIRFTPILYSRLLADPTELCCLTPAQFEELVADRLHAMGLGVKLVGNTNRKDGGIDILAWPKRSVAFPFLIAAQVKHHRAMNRHTAVADVRDFIGAITCSKTRFQFGLVVTNTHFTADAKWAASQFGQVLRLRDLEDFCRWMGNDFISDEEWREMPNEIELAPGIRVSLDSIGGRKSRTRK